MKMYIIVRSNGNSGPWCLDTFYEGAFGTAASIADWRGPYRTKKEAIAAMNAANRLMLNKSKRRGGYYNV